MTGKIGIEHLADAEMIGRGGFGAVYAATDKRFDRRVAVKVLGRPLADKDRLAFERECKIMGRMSAHPNVVTVHDAGYTDDDHPYLIMELVEGGTLADQLATKGPLPWRAAVDYLIPIADAIGAGHSQGIEHRDVKPDNILIDGDKPLLTDFGIARLRDATGSASTQITASWLHAPPETFESKRDNRSDLYSLVSTLHALITGQAPFWSSQDDSLSPLMFRLLSQPAPLLPPELGPPALARVLQAGLAKDPALRPQTSAELIEQLRSTAAQPSRPIDADANAAASAEEDAVGFSPEATELDHAVASARALPARPVPFTNSLRSQVTDDSDETNAVVAQVKHALGTSTVATAPPTAAPLRPAPAAEASAPKPVVSAAAAAGVDRLQAPARNRRPNRLLAGIGVGVAVLLAATVAVTQPFGKTEQTDPARGTSTASAELAASGLAATAPSGPTSDSTEATADEESASPTLSPESPFVEGPYESPPRDVDGSATTNDGDVGIRSLTVTDDERSVFGQTNGVVGFVRNPVDGGVELEQFEGHESGSFIFAVSGLEDGRIASGGSDNTVQIWHPDDLESAPVVFTGHTDTVHDLAVLADGRIVSASVDTTVQVWDPQNTSQVVTFTGHSSGVLGVTVLPDGRVASSSWDNTVQVWDPDAPDADPIVYNGHRDDVFAVVGLADGRVVSAGVDTTVQVWDPDDLGAEPIVLSGHQASVESLVVIDSLIVSGGDDDFILIWDLEDLGAEPARLDGQTRGTPAIANYDDSQFIASRGDGTYAVWDPVQPVS